MSLTLEDLIPGKTYVFKLAPITGRHQRGPIERRDYEATYLGKHPDGLEHYILVKTPRGEVRLYTPIIGSITLKDA